jgi:hypothetical protein
MDSKSIDNKLTEAQKREFCGMLLKNYGLHLDPLDDMLPAYYMMYKAGEVTKDTAYSSQDQSRRTWEEVQRVVADLKAYLQNMLDLFSEKLSAIASTIEIRQITFSSNYQAFSYGLGRWGLATSLAIIALFAAWAIESFRGREDRKTEVLSTFSQNSDLLEKDSDKRTTVSYIKLHQADSYGGVIPGEHFLYNKECDCIEVPLYFKPK